MSEPCVLALAFGPGFLRFAEPCSVGADGIFSYLRHKDRARRLRETARFALSRAAVLGLFGTGVALLCGRVLPAQKGLWLSLGLLYLASGLAVILDARLRLGLFGRVRFARLLPKRATAPWGSGYYSV